MNNIDTRSVNSIRILSADAVQKANSGHPGLPLGAAPMAYELWAHHMKHNPKNPNWANRDRFILSAGHGSAMLYSLLHLFGYGDLSIDDLKQFRQLNSLTPGHPEYRHTVGIEATTGPLGAGMAMGVGMAMAEAHLAAIFNKENYNVVDHHTFILAGDGCMMEGISSEAMSLAGTLKLSKLIVLYDSNNISIEGDTDIAFSENVAQRFASYGFHVLHVEDGNDTVAIGKAIEQAKSFTDAPTMIEIKTKIGFGSAREGMASAHGEPLGADNILALKEKLGYDSVEDFYVPADVYENFKAINEANALVEENWNKLFASYCETYPKMAKKWNQYHDAEAGLASLDDESFWAVPEKADATRNISGNILNVIKDIFPNLIGGSADLAPSNKTNMKGAGDYHYCSYEGRNLHFGVRELAMAGIGNGLALHGGLRPYVSTFFVFADYCKPMMRLSSIMGVPVIYIFTHDSIGVGEDGPTHEPIEQLAMLRAQPNLTVYRPADAKETAAAYYYALHSKTTPTVLVLTRQNLPQLAGTSKEALKGAYVVSEAKKEMQGILIATGSEVELAIRAQEALASENIHFRVVSMPSMDVFEEQSKEYKESILPSSITKRVAVEALSEFGWGKYVGLEGATVCMTTFGASAPAKVLFEHFGFTVENVVATVKSIL